jgi:pyrroline-5-carboxylate reductase
MPNTPLMYGLGSSALVKQDPVTDEQFEFIRGCFNSCGVTCVVDESEINTVIAISGSAPAYVLKMADTLINYGVANGLSYDDASKLVLQVFAGCSKMAAQSDSTIKQLIDAVTSPNGTTEAGLKSLNNNNFDQTIISCLEATVNRAEELSK